MSWDSEKRKLLKDINESIDNFQKHMGHGWDASDLALLASGIGQITKGMAGIDAGKPILDKFKGEPDDDD